VDRAHGAKILDHATGAFDILATCRRTVPRVPQPAHAASGFGSSQFREPRSRGSGGAGYGGRLGAALEAPGGDRALARRRSAAELASRGTCLSELSRIDRRMRSPSLRDLVALLLQSPELCGQDDAELRQRVDEVASSNVAALHQEYRREALHPQGDLGIRMSNRWREIGRLLAPPEHIGLSWLYRNPDRHPALVALLDACYGFDECLTRWRHVHVAFVERMIGARPGTGGGGVEYLRKTLELPSAFPWLKDFRTILMASLSY
jgi:tryptophan 2,3-dioxygenase